MTFVVDSSVALKWVLPEIDTPRAVALRDDFRNGVHELLAPDVFAIEVAHALARAERRKIIHPPEGRKNSRTFSVPSPSCTPTCRYSPAPSKSRPPPEPGSTTACMWPLPSARRVTSSPPTTG
jgi:predicted nucleic acid-binding protein